VAGEVLKVSPSDLESAATAFDQSAGALGALEADAPLGDGAAAVAQLATGAACRAAQSEVAAAVTALADDLARYGSNLRTAVARYAGTDQAAAGAIAKAGV